MAIEFNGIEIPSEYTACPRDATGWDDIAIDRDEEKVVITYKCGTSREVLNDPILRIVQSDACVRNELKLVRATENELQSALRAAESENSQLESELQAAQSQIESLEAQLAAVEGGNQAARFILTFGTPKEK